MIFIHDIIVITNKWIYLREIAMKKQIAMLMLFSAITLNSTHAAKLEIPTDDKVIQTYGASSQSALNPKNIKLLVWNMFKGDIPSWEEDYHFLKTGHDIILLQEMYLEDRMKRVYSTHEGFEYHTAASFIYKERKDKHSDKMLTNVRTGVINASKVAATKVEFQRSIPREPIIKTPKMIIMTTYPIQGTDKKLLVINIHAINFVSTHKLSLQVLPALEASKKHDGPVVFGGDFNVWSPGKTRFLKRAMRNFGFSEVIFKKQNDTRMRTLGHILDYVFVKGLTPGYRRIWGEIEGSDHKAITVHFKMKNL